MKLLSMTGFARAEGARGDMRWYWELRSVNGRGLDLRIRLPQGYDSLDPKLREVAQKKLNRGNLQVALNVQNDAVQSELRVNMQAVDQILAAADRIQKSASLPPLTVDGLFAARGVIELSEPATSSEEQEAVRAELAATFEQAIEALVAARAQEGARIGAVLEEQIGELERLVREALDSPARTPAAIEDRLREQVARLMNGSDQLDPDRLHQEAMVLATKADIQEELDRFAAHLASARELIEGGGPVGRKLDFLAQEFNREANTMCAKANHASLSAIGLQIKLVVDQFREQVQNIE